MGGEKEVWQAVFLAFISFYHFCCKTTNVRKFLSTQFTSTLVVLSVPWVDPPLATTTTPPLPVMLDFSTSSYKTFLHSLFHARLSRTRLHPYFLLRILYNKFKKNSTHPPPSPLKQDAPHHSEITGLVEKIEGLGVGSRLPETLL